MYTSQACITHFTRMLKRFRFLFMHLAKVPRTFERSIVKRRSPEDVHFFFLLRDRPTVPPPSTSLPAGMATLALKAARSARALRRSLEGAVIGQTALKDALVLALVSREHLYVEGPPGIGKTALAEAAATATGRSSFFAQLHRDTRLSELISDAVIRRERGTDGAEVIRSDVRAGALLTSKVAVLDDISRAPGEALNVRRSLNVLLRLLNERKYHDRPIPLLTAIATGNPTSSEFYNEPLDPATLDRFALQLRTEGLVGGGDWGEASSVIDQFGDSPFCS